MLTCCQKAIAATGAAARSSTDVASRWELHSLGHNDAYKEALGTSASDVSAAVPATAYQDVVTCSESGFRCVLLDLM